MSEDIEIDIEIYIEIDRYMSFRLELRSRKQIKISWILSVDMKIC